MATCRKCLHIFQVLEEKNSELCILYLANRKRERDLRSQGEIKTFSGEEKLREFVAIKPSLNEWQRKSSKQKENDSRRLGALERMMLE
jgi:hypothetical protein